jgi:hypothetical protein
MTTRSLKGIFRRRASMHVGKSYPRRRRGVVLIALVLVLSGASLSAAPETVATVSTAAALPGPPATHPAWGSASLAAAPFVTSWTAPAKGAVLRYEIQRLVDAAGYIRVAVTGPTTRSVRTFLRGGHTYRFRVRWFDRNGWPSGWAYGRQLTTTRFQDGNWRLTYTGSWRIRRSTTFSGGSIHETSTAGAPATFRFTGTDITIVGPRGPHRGRALVYVDGVYRKTIDTYARSDQVRSVLWWGHWSSPGAHSVTVRVAGTVGRPWVGLDAFFSVTPTVTPTPTPTPSPTPTPPPPVTPNGVYGSVFNADNLNNTQIGGPFAQKASYRFRAEQTSGLSSVRLYVITGVAGYAGGTGGRFRLEVQTDDGSASHFPSGGVLASQDWTPVDGAGRLITFGSPATLTAGTLYHLVISNIDADPVTNFASVDGTYMYHTLTPRQPGWPDTDLYNLVRLGSGQWDADTSLRQITPVVVFTYANGASQGQGYIESWHREAKTINAAQRARETFTVNGGTRTVSSVAVRLARVSGSSPLRIRLETGTGVLIEEAPVPGSGSIGLQTNAGLDSNQNDTWVTLAFASSHVLTAGQSYNLVLTSPADTAYSIYAIRKGMDYGYPSTTYFNDGKGQYDPGIGTFGPFTSLNDRLLDKADLQFYFR